jgi:acetoin utilization protein AcuC
MADLPLLVFGPNSPTYDFGPSHPLTPRRFGPGIDLLRAVGAEPGLAPEPAPDAELLWCHTQHYIDAIRAFSDGHAEPWSAREVGIGPGDDPPFHGMHEAAAAVAGGSIRAMEAILRGDVGHAFHPGGGLHHAMPSRASGFCIYDDPALAIARARRDGLRVLYVDLDVHHGDGVEMIHEADPGVLTVSFHESGRYLFPGTGRVGDLGEGDAAGSLVNVPLEPETGEGAWLHAVETLLPELAASFGPDLVVSQHGCDTHATDPLAHLNVTTTAMGRAARLVDTLAHRFANGRWLSTGGGGYGVYRVVPRAWAQTWLAAAHREVPERIPEAWLGRWRDEAARYGDRELPTTFDDPPNAGMPMTASQRDAERASTRTADLVRELVVPRIVRAAVDAGTWSPLGREADAPAVAATQPSAGRTAMTILDTGDAATVERLEIAPRLIANLAPHAVKRLLVSAVGGLTLAVDGDTIVGLAASMPTDHGGRELTALAVAPPARRSGLASELIRRHIASVAPPHAGWRARVTVAERDPVEPLDRGTRATIARRLLEGAGFEVSRVTGEIGRADPLAVDAVRR